MRKALLSRQAKIVVDILLLLGVILCIRSDKSYVGSATGIDYWLSFHALNGILWYLLMLMHIWQHWSLIKLFVRKRVVERNRITFITIILFILISSSLLFMLISMTDQSIKFHHVFSHLFMLILLIHVIQKSKRFIALFRSR